MPRLASCARVELDAHRVLLRAVDLDLRDARDRRDALRHHDLAVLVELRQRQDLRGQRQVEDRLVGGIDLAVGRRRRHVGRQLAARGGDRRLDVERGAVEVARQVELQRDLRRALARASRTCCPGRRSSRTASRAASRPTTPSSRARRPAAPPTTWIVGKSTFGQIGDRQQPVRHDAEDQDARHDERRHDGAADEELGDVHDCVASAAPRPVTTSIFAPGREPQLPVRDDAFRPARAPSRSRRPRARCAATVTGRDSTVWSALTT